MPYTDYLNLTFKDRHYLHDSISELIRETSSDAGSEPRPKQWRKGTF